MTEPGRLDFSEILASTVHDIKNALGMLLHSLDELGAELREKNLSEHERLATLQYETQRVNNDLVQLLSLYKIDRDLLSANIDQYQLLEFLEAELCRYEPLLQMRKVRCELSCLEDLYGYFDRDLLGGVLGNVIANSVRYARSAIRISAGPDGDEGFVLSVEDDGEGFPEPMLKAGQPERHGSDFVTGSTNLGLYFAHRIARLHRQQSRAGQIKLENGGELGGGRFSIHIP